MNERTGTILAQFKFDLFFVVTAVIQSDVYQSFGSVGLILVRISPNGSCGLLGNSLFHRCTFCGSMF